MPMFPLNNGLVPHAMVPLRVFEDRYLTMMSELGERGTFGVVLIERGSEVGGDDKRFSVGTSADIVARQDREAGDVVVVARGRARIRVQGWLTDDPYPVARVVELFDEPLLPDRSWEELSGLARRAVGLASELGIDIESSGLEISQDPVVATYQAMAVVPLSAMDRQRLLELDSSAERLAATSGAIADFIQLAEFQLAGPT